MTVERNNKMRKDTFKKIWNSYNKSMNNYGEALLKSSGLNHESNNDK